MGLCSWSGAALAFTAPQFAAVPSVPSCPANPESGRQLLPRASVVVFAVVEKRFPEPKSLSKEESKDARAESSGSPTPGLAPSRAPSVCHRRRRPAGAGVRSPWSKGAASQGPWLRLHLEAHPR